MSASAATPEALLSVIVNPEEVNRWVGQYLAAFAACGRGESRASSLLAYYGVPLLLSTDEDGYHALTTADEVVSMAQKHIDGMRAAEYDHSDVLDFEISPLNSVSALYRGSFSRRSRDGKEIGRLTATYLMTGTPNSRRISVLAVHSS